MSLDNFDRYVMPTGETSEQSSDGGFISNIFKLLLSEPIFLLRSTLQEENSLAISAVDLN